MRSTAASDVKPWLLYCQIVIVISENQLKFKGITRKKCIRSTLELTFSTIVCTELMKTCKKNLIILKKFGPISL